MKHKLLSRFIDFDDGASFVYTLLALPVLLGVVGLAVDSTTLLSSQTELQDLADASALAGAYELDGTDAGVAAAIAAAQNAVVNSPLIPGDAPPAVDIQTPRFYPTLVDAINNTNATTVGTRAIFIRVDAEPRSVGVTFMAALVGDTAMTAGAAAIASSYIAACNVQPLMLCNPLETAVSTPDFDPTPGQLFVFNPKGGGNDYAPGDFGLVDPPGYTSSGANDVRDLLSLQSRGVCYANQVNPRTGHATNMVSWGINVRFDQEPSGCGGNCTAELTSAPHVLDGLQPKNAACNQFDPVPYNAATERPTYPRDTAFTVVGGSRIGNGVMSASEKNAYWQFHHGQNWPADIETRYEAYLAELEMMEDLAADWGRDPPREDPAPACLPVSPAGADRRVIAVAVVNCLDWNVRGNSVNQIRADRYGEFFLTEPSASGEIFAEFIRMIEPDDSGGKLKRILQLYR